MLLYNIFKYETKKQNKTLFVELLAAHGSQVYGNTRFFAPYWYMIKRFSSFFSRSLEHSTINLAFLGIIKKKKKKKKNSNFLRNFTRTVLIILSPNKEWRKIFLPLLSKVLRSRINSCYCILFSNMKQKHTLLIELLAVT